MKSQNHLRVGSPSGDDGQSTSCATFHQSAPKIYAARLGCQPSRAGIQQRVLSVPSERRRLLYLGLIRIERWLVILGVVLVLFLLLPVAAGARATWWQAAQRQ